MFGSRFGVFWDQPRRFLRQAGLRVMAFAGEDKEYQALLDVVLEAPLVGRWELTIYGKNS